MGKRIMIVDDSMYSRMELRNLLLSHGYSVVGEAATGSAAIDMYEKLKPDLVMVDARMPEMDGVCTIKQIRLMDPEAVMMICAGSGEKSTVMEAMSAGAVDFCPKPYVERVVTNTVRRALIGFIR
jgi:two-component system chemotaxis response regulator CheY